MAVAKKKKQKIVFIYASFLEFVKKKLVQQSGDLRKYKQSIETITLYFKTKRPCLFCFREASCKLRIHHRFFPVFKKPRTRYTNFCEDWQHYKYKDSCYLKKNPPGFSIKEPKLKDISGVLHHKDDDDYGKSKDSIFADDGLPTYLVKPCLKKIFLRPTPKGVFYTIDISKLLQRPIYFEPATQPSLQLVDLVGPSKEEKSSAATIAARSSPSFYDGGRSSFFAKKKRGSMSSHRYNFSVCAYSPALLALISSQTLKSVRQSSWIPCDENQDKLRSPYKYSASRSSSNSSSSSSSNKSLQFQTRKSENLGSRSVASKNLEIDMNVEMHKKFEQGGISIVNLLNQHSEFHFQINQQRYHERKVRGFLLKSKSLQKMSSARDYTKSMSALKQLKTSAQNPLRLDIPLSSKQDINFNNLDHWEAFIPPQGFVLTNPSIEQLQGVYNSTTESECAATDKSEKTLQKQAAICEISDSLKETIIDVASDEACDFFNHLPAKKKTGPGKKEKMNFVKPVIDAELPWYYFHSFIFVH